MHLKKARRIQKQKKQATGKYALNPYPLIDFPWQTAVEERGYIFLYNLYTLPIEKNIHSIVRHDDRYLRLDWKRAVYWTLFALASYSYPAK